MWMEIDFRYMMEESEGEDDIIRQHKLQWRSRGTYSVTTRPVTL